MKLLLEDIPSAHTPPPKISRGRVPRQSSPSTLSRRRFVQAGVGVATGAGLAALGWLPTAKLARASHSGTDGYQIKPLPCPSYASDHNCSQGSSSGGCGPSTIYFDACQNNQANHYFGWHKAGQCEWILRKNDCSGSTYDGWRWDPGNCGLCCPTVYRCHDGYKRGLQYCNILDKSICRWVVTCGNC